MPNLRYGLADLDGYGVWSQSSEFGTVWKPKAPAGWAPFRNGKWQWYEGLGYTWVGDDPWGWLPYHYGRWMQQEGTGWFWAPGQSAVFKPGDVYWLRSAKLVGWGALAPGENWKPPDAPRLYLNVNTTYARYAADSLEIDPASFTPRPQEPLATAVFTQALPSPPFPAARLDAFRPPLRAGSTHAISVLSEGAFEGPPEPRVEAQQGVQPNPAASDASYSNGPLAAPPMAIVETSPAEVPVEVDVAVPVYTGIIVVNPPGYRAPPPRNPSKPVATPASGSSGDSVPPPHTPRQPKPKIPEPEKPVR